MSLTHAPAGSRESDKATDPNDAVGSFTLDRQSSIPLYQQLTHHIVHAISTGRIASGSVLPSVRSLSRQLQLAPATIQRAYAELHAEGLVVREPGRGVFVAALGDHHLIAQDRRQATLREILGPAVRQARELGFLGDEIVSAAREASGSAHSIELHPRIAFVVPVKGAADRYVRILRARLPDCDVEGFEIDRSRTGAVLTAATPPDLVVCTVSAYSLARKTGDLLGVPVYALVVGLEAATMRRLLEIPADADIGLVAEAEYLSNTHALVDQVLGHRGDLRSVSAHGGAAMTRALSQCDTVLHTFGTRREVESHVQPGTRVIELTFAPIEESLSHLAAMVSELALHKRGYA